MQGILNDNKELRKLILENPDLPLLIFAGEDCNSGEYSYELASCRCGKGKVLDAPDTVFIPRTDYIYTDEDELHEHFVDNFEGRIEFEKLTDKEFFKEVEKAVKELEPYWKECIILYVSGF